MDRRQDIDLRAAVRRHWPRGFLAAVTYAKDHLQSTGRVGCVGFCWGRAMANQLAVHSPNLAAAVAFYGRQPAAQDVPKIGAAVQLHYAGLDSRITAGIPAYEAGLKQAGIRYELYIVRRGQSRLSQRYVADTVRRGGGEAGVEAHH